MDIRNDKLLNSLALELGYEEYDWIDMTHQSAYRAHSKNKIDKESIVTVKKPK